MRSGHTTHYTLQTANASQSLMRRHACCTPHAFWHYQSTAITWRFVVYKVNENIIWNQDWRFIPQARITPACEQPLRKFLRAIIRRTGREFPKLWLCDAHCSDKRSRKRCFVCSSFCSFALLVTTVHLQFPLPVQAVPDWLTGCG